jgi:hypothetical protein
MRAWPRKSQVGVYAPLHLGLAGRREFSVEEDFAQPDGSDANDRNTFTDPMKGGVC